MTTHQTGYVYLLYYYDIHAEGLARNHQCDSVVYTTLEAAKLRAETRAGQSDWKEVTFYRWGLGNYWIDRRAILDPDNVGIEVEMREDNPFRTTLSKRVKL